MQIDEDSLDWFLHTDEAGSNTNMKDNDKRAGGKVAGRAGEKVRQNVSTKDAHYTILPFVSSRGNAVLCVVILKAGSKLKAEWESGEDLFNLLGDELHPYGPVCKVGNISLPTFVAVSESGGITPEILKEALARIDASGLYGLERAEAACDEMDWELDDMLGAPKAEIAPTSKGRTPCLLLDGHGSRLSLVFLRYVDMMKSGTRWGVVLGIPNVTHHWQVGDAEEQNGAFKGSLAKN